MDLDTMSATASDLYKYSQGMEVLETHLAKTMREKESLQRKLGTVLANEL